MQVIQCSVALRTYLTFVRVIAPLPTHQTTTDPHSFFPKCTVFFDKLVVCIFDIGNSSAIRCHRSLVTIEQNGCQYCPILLRDDCTVL